jgi:hypothetical protein
LTVGYLFDQVGVTGLWLASTDRTVETHRLSVAPGALSPTFAVVAEQVEHCGAVNQDGHGHLLSCVREADAVVDGVDR